MPVPRLMYAIETAPGRTSLPAGRSRPQWPRLMLTIGDLQDLKVLIEQDRAAAWVDARVLELADAGQGMPKAPASESAVSQHGKGQPPRPWSALSVPSGRGTSARPR